MDDFAKEANALEALARAAKAVAECRRLFDEAGMEYPPTLRRMLGESPSGEAKKEPTPPPRPLKLEPVTPRREAVAVAVAPIPAPADLTPPPWVDPKWVAVPKNDASPQTFVRAALRDAKGPTSAKQIVEAAAKLGRDINDGAAWNALARLADEVQKTPDGWRLIDKGYGAVFTTAYAWSAPEMFTPQEIAARRRAAIRYLLERSENGLARPQIVQQLGACEWLNAPFTNDLVKSDLERMEREGRVTRSDDDRWLVSLGRAA